MTQKHEAIVTPKLWRPELNGVFVKYGKNT